MKSSSVCLFACFLVVLFLGGCGDHVPVGGRVTFSDDGAPVSGTVYFQSDTHLARGALQKDGSYVLGSEKAKDGLPPGTYKVYVQGLPVEVGKTQTGEPIFEESVDAKFANPAMTELVFEAGKDGKRFDFQVDRPKK